jgi:hypothetical protein
MAAIVDRAQYFRRKGECGKRQKDSIFSEPVDSGQAVKPNERF